MVSNDKKRLKRLEKTSADAKENLRFTWPWISLAIKLPVKLQWKLSLKYEFLDFKIDFHCDFTIKFTYNLFASEMNS